jgi:hypothetical protein
MKQLHEETPPIPPEEKKTATTNNNAPPSPAKANEKKTDNAPPSPAKANEKKTETTEKAPPKPATTAEDVPMPTTNVDDNNKTEALSTLQQPMAINFETGTIVNQWKLGGKLGEGVYGAVFECRKADGKNTEEYAMKVRVFCPNYLYTNNQFTKFTFQLEHQRDINLLVMEMDVYNALMEKPFRRRHHPMKIDSGSWDNYNYLVMSLIGPSLQVCLPSISFVL